MVRSRKHFFQVIYYTPYRRSSSIEGCIPSKVVFRQRSSSIKDCLPLKVIFRQRLSSIKSRIPLKVVFCQKLSSVKGRLPPRSFSSFGSFSFLGFSREYGIAYLSLLLFMSSSWSTSKTSIIFLFELVHLNDLICDE